ncbi:MAG: nucleotidyl transferase AbiEii/AbiGii toxin family protein [Oligoflexales bacterium]|nr:nucleotidyl transferase AbiEii/AbiGii toxin family protein [Oligoflexales bacterium]
MTFDRYRNQVDLLLDVLPIIAKHRQFALKGGTALNLFYLDMPRLSVDIDLCYLPIGDRESSLKNMHNILSQIKKEIEQKLGSRVIPTKPLNGKDEARLIVIRGNAEIKVEPNYIIRGALFEPSDLSTSLKVELEFGKVSTIQCLNFKDLYGGKICAALDRQHPRDLFDIQKFFERDALNEQIIDAFIYYLFSHNRPFHEILNPTEKQVDEVFETEFKGMTNEQVDIANLIKARTTLIQNIVRSLDEKSRNLILTFSSADPDWNLYRYPKIQDYPSVKWRIFNIKKMTLAKKIAQRAELEQIFETSSIN